MDSGVCHMAHFRDPDGNALMLHHRYAPKHVPRLDGGGAARRDATTAKWRSTPSCESVRARSQSPVLARFRSPTPGARLRGVTPPQ